jgi:hypothetical protein
MIQDVLTHLQLSQKRWGLSNGNRVYGLWFSCQCLLCAHVTNFSRGLGFRLKVREMLTYMPMSSRRSRYNFLRKIFSRVYSLKGLNAGQEGQLEARLGPLHAEWRLVIVENVMLLEPSSLADFA